MYGTVTELVDITQVPYHPGFNLRPTHKISRINHNLDVLAHNSTTSLLCISAAFCSLSHWTIVLLCWLTGLVSHPTVMTHHRLPVIRDQLVMYPGYTFYSWTKPWHSHVACTSGDKVTGFHRKHQFLPFEDVNLCTNPSACRQPLSYHCPCVMSLHLVSKKALGEPTRQWLWCREYVCLSANLFYISSTSLREEFFV